MIMSDEFHTRASTRVRERECVSARKIKRIANRYRHGFECHSEPYRSRYFLEVREEAISLGLTENEVVNIFEDVRGEYGATS